MWVASVSDRNHTKQQLLLLTLSLLACFTPEPEERLHMVAEDVSTLSERVSKLGDSPTQGTLFDTQETIICLNAAES